MLNRHNEKCTTRQRAARMYVSLSLRIILLFLFCPRLKRFHKHPQNHFRHIVFTRSDSSYKNKLAFLKFKFCNELKQVLQRICGEAAFCYCWWRLRCVCGGTESLVFGLGRHLQDFEIVEGEARVVTANTVRVGERTIKADRILLATGASPRILPIDGLQSVPYVTHEGAFELDLLPESLIVLGGRYVALECAQMFARFGSKVTILQRSSHVLPTESKDVSEEIASHLVNEGVVLHTNVKISKCLKRGGNAVVIAVVNGKPMEFTAALLLVATGHTPNNAAVDDLADINLDGGGYITVNEYLETSVPGVFAAGDVIGDPSFVYTAAYEGGLAASNACMDSTKAERNYTGLPWVVFTDPQVAGVGIDETQAKLDGIAVDVSVLPMASVPRCIAARDTRGFVKLIRHSSTKVILGARVVAAEGSELLMELSLAIKHGITSRELAASFHPYLTLSEAVKLAAIAFDTPVGKLSCCAN